MRSCAYTHTHTHTHIHIAILRKHLKLDNTVVIGFMRSKAPKPQTVDGRQTDRQTDTDTHTHTHARARVHTYTYLHSNEFRDHIS